MIEATELFQRHRELLFAVAYRMLGSVADAEDVVQDSWLKWSNVDIDEVDSPKAYLVRIAANTALNRLTSAQARRETYVGPWLPEPILTSPDITEDAELADSVSMAMLIVMESLSPEERAVFVLREVFGFSHTEIAAALDRTEAGVRQLAHRARAHVRKRRPRFDPDGHAQRQATQQFLAAATGGDINQLMEILAPDVTLWTDGGGKVRAALRGISGADKVARFIAAVVTKPWRGHPPEELSYSPASINGSTGIIMRAHDQAMGAVTIEFINGRVTAIHLIANPDKLTGLSDQFGRRA